MADPRLILGTAGHIDHGKTALVRSLTGIDTDRLQQEKQRGISIDVGFAHLDLAGDSAGDLAEHRLGVVDLPGHERFIRNMLAGACGIDLALLVVAADDSVMPQTREHLAILELLRVRHGLVVLTKVDLAEAGWIDLVEREVRDLVAGTFLEGAPIVRTSVVDGTGLDELKARLAEACRSVEPRRCDDHFRLAVDRSFVLRGLGTVITGTVWTGRVGVGDQIDWLPVDKPIRVRGIHCHGREVEFALAGQRAALKVAGAHHTEIRRGHVVASRGYLRPARLITVSLSLLQECPRPLKHRGRVRLYVGTQEVMADVSLLAGNVLMPGRSCPAQLRCAEPVAAVNRQPFVVRAESPLWTIGGGIVLQPVARPISRRDAKTIGRLESLGAGDDLLRAAAAVYFNRAHALAAHDLCREADLRPTSVESVLERLDGDGRTVVLGAGPRHERRVHRDFYREARQRIVKALRRLHAESPLETAIPMPTLVRGVGSLDAETVAAIVERLRRESVLVGGEQAVALADFEPVLTEAQRRLYGRALEAFRAAGLRPPALAELSRALGVSHERLRPVVDLCAGQGHLVHLEGTMYLHRDWAEQVSRQVTDGLRRSEGMTVSQIKDLLGVSRKHAIPICAYLDRIGVTRRENDLRVLA